MSIIYVSSVSPSVWSLNFGQFRSASNSSQCETNAVDDVAFALLDVDLKVPCKKSGPDPLYFLPLSFYSIYVV